MSRKLVSTLCLCVFSCSVVVVARHTHVKVRASNGFPVHNLDTGLNYTSIQEAIDAVDTLSGHTIFAEEGIYYENVNVNKSVSLVGEDRSLTIVDGNGTGKVVYIVANNVSITDFTIRKSGTGLYDCGIWVESINNSISHNTITNNNDGIVILSSYNNIYSNNITDNIWGIGFGRGSKFNGIFGNIITQNWERGISLYYSSNNTISGNNITNNGSGIYLDWSSSNILYHNSFVDNGNQVSFYVLRNNVWDNGYPSGGNYWSDYTGVDSDPDGIGDSQHAIDANNTDHYPLMGMFHSFNATSEYNVQTICNYTISDFQHNGTAISFDVTGENGSAGFCRICIPTALMSDYQIFVNGTEVDHDLLPVSNSTHSYLYFTYDHSTKEVVIIPEFPSLLLLPLFMLSTLLAAMIYNMRVRDIACDVS